MTEENETVIRTEAGVRLVTSPWDDGDVWLGATQRYASMSIVLTKHEALELLLGLQKVLAANLEQAS
jgi:hypothetical protein